MAKQRIYYPRTTYSQRQTLFETWEATGDIKAAYEAAHTSRRTFYYWKGRFEEGGYEGLNREEKAGAGQGDVGIDRNTGKSGGDEKEPS